MEIFEIRHFQHITIHQLSSKRINHVIVMKRDEQGIVVQKQAKLGEIKVDVLGVINSAHDIHIRIICSITIFQQQQILYVQWALCFINWLGSICIARKCRI